MSNNNDPLSKPDAPDITGELASIHTQMDDSTKKLLAESDVEAGKLFHHGFFPKEIARYLLARLREGDIPCEMGFDRQLGERSDGRSVTLKKTFKDPSPYYFLAMPVEYRKKARLLLDDTSYPMEKNEAAEMMAKTIMAQKKVRQQKVDMKRLFAYLAFSFVGGLAILAFVFIAMEIIK